MKHGIGVQENPDGAPFLAQIYQVTEAVVADDNAFRAWCGMLLMDLRNGNAVTIKVVKGQQHSG